MLKDFLVIIPAYNEEQTIGKVIGGLKNVGFENILVIDDGSHDSTAKAAEGANAKTIVNERNLGAGGATAKGFEYAKNKGYQFLITVDGDGQHDPTDVKSVATELITNEDNPDIVIGDRVTNMWKVNKPRFIFNVITSLALFVLTGRYIKDTQSGLKAFNRKSIERLRIKSRHYDFCFEIVLRVIYLNLTLKEIPIKAIYTSYSLKKGQSVFNAANLLWQLVKLRIKLIKDV